MSVAHHFTTPIFWRCWPGRAQRIRIVGLAGSPSCGVNTTSSGYAGGRVRECEHERVPGKGVFMEELLAELERRGDCLARRRRSGRRSE